MLVIIVEGRLYDGNIRRRDQRGGYNRIQQADQRVVAALDDDSVLERILADKVLERAVAGSVVFVDSGRSCPPVIILPFDPTPVKVIVRFVLPVFDEKAKIVRFFLKGKKSDVEDDLLKIEHADAERAVDRGDANDCRSNRPLWLSAAKTVLRCIVDPARRRLVELAGEVVTSIVTNVGAVGIEANVEDVLLKVGSNADVGVGKGTPEMGAKFGFLRRRPR